MLTRGALYRCFELSTFYESRAAPYRVMLWITIPWISLIWGAAYSCWGALLAAPERQAGNHFNLRAVVKRPLLANAVCLLLPLMQSVSIIIPGVISSKRSDDALSGYLDWQQKYANDQSLSREALVDALDIWAMLLNGVYPCVIAFSIWVLWAGLFFFAFSKITAGLFFDIVRHARRLNSNFVRQESSSWKKRLPRTMKPQVIMLRKSSTTLPAREEKHASSSGHSSTGEEGIGNPRALATPEGLARGWQASQLNSGSASGDEAGESAEQRRIRAIEAGLEEMMQIGADTMHVFSQREIAEDRPHTSFFPPVKPSKVIGQAAAAPVGSSARVHHARLFRRLVINFGFQFSGICLAILVFMAIALYMAVEFFASFENNTAGYCIGYALLLAMWATVVFGAITLSAIAARTYETAIAPGGLSQTSAMESAPNAGLFTEMPPANSVLAASGRKPKLKKLPFTRATRRATALAHEATVPGVDETYDNIGARNGGAQGDDEEDDSSGTERLAQLRSPTSVTFEQWGSTYVDGRKLLTPEDFQANKKTPRATSSRRVSALGQSHAGNGSPPRVEPDLNLDQPLNQPMSPATRRHTHTNSGPTAARTPAGPIEIQEELRDHMQAMGTEMATLDSAGRQREQQQQKPTPIPRIAYSHDEPPAADQTFDHTQYEAAQGDDSDLE